MKSGNDSALKSDSKQRANPSSHHVAGSAEPPRSRSSISAFWIKFTLWWNFLWQKMVSKTRNSDYDGMRKQGGNEMVGKQRNDLIPKERNGVSLTGDERQVYEILLDVVEKRRQCGISNPRVLVITDLAKDYDDLAAMAILKELHRIGVIELLGFIANLQPEEKRARFGRGALDHLDLKHILIATGTSGYPHGSGNHKEEAYEFDCPFMADENDPRLRNESLHEPLTGNDLLTKFCQDAAKTGQKLTLLLISSLEDIHTFSISNKLLLKKSISNVVLQGGYRITAEEQLEALPEANNNRYDIEAAKNFHALMQELQINSTVYTRVAAVAATMEPEIFAILAKTGNEVGKHLWNVQKAQDLSFYRNASHEDPAKRFRPDRDREYFLRTRTNWYDNHSDKDPQPEGEEVSDYTKVVVYDALAAIGVSGEDSLKALNVLNIQPDSTASDSEHVRDLKRRHKVVGYEIKRIANGKEVLESEVPGINVEQMVNSLKAFLKGSLISAPLLGSKETDRSPGAPERPRIR